MMSDKHLMQFLRQYKNSHKEEYSLSRLGVFGSVARKDDASDSDLDIVVEFVKPNLFIQSQIREDLQDALKREIDVIALSDHMNPKLLKRIEQDVIYV